MSITQRTNKKNATPEYKAWAHLDRPLCNDKVSSLTKATARLCFLLTVTWAFTAESMQGMCHNTLSH